MKIKAYSFQQNNSNTTKVKSEICNKLTDTAVFFENYSDPNELFANISEALKTANAILIGTPAQTYLKFKTVLIKAFGFTPAYSGKIEDAIGSAVTDEKLLKAHTLVPNESTELLSQDGLYSGFYVSSGEQYIVVFPLDDEITPFMFDSLKLPFIKEQENKEEALKEIESETSSEKAKRIVTKLVKNELRLSVPSTPTVALMKEDIKACKNYENFIFFTPFVNDAGAQDKKAYSAELAHGAMELRSADLGASVSNIFREKDGDRVKCYYTFISVATPDKTVIRKLIADSTENIESLVTEAIDELYTMLDKYIDEAIFRKTATREEIEKFENAQIEAEYVSDVRPVAKLGKKGIIAAVSILAVAVIICIILGFKFRGYFVNPGDEVSTSLQAAPSVSFTIPTTLPQSTTLPGVTEPSSETTTDNLTILAPESTSSIFTNPVTIAVPQPYSYNTYTYNNTPAYNPPETTKKSEPTTKKKQEKKKTEKQTTKKATTEPSTDDNMHGEM